MKNILTALATALFLLLPAPGFTAYIIHLKDGTKFVTDQYFEEGDQIKFKRYGGLIGIERDRIRDIVETDTAAEPTAKKEPIAEPAPPPAKAEKEVSNAEDLEKEEVTGEKEGEAGWLEEKKRKTNNLTNEQKELVGKYIKDLKGYRAKFKNLNLMPLEDLNEFYKELDTFRKTVLTKRLGSFFENEILEVYTMMEKIQKVMKFKMG